MNPTLLASTLWCLALPSIAQQAEKPVPEMRLQNSSARQSTGFVIEPGELHVQDLVNDAAAFLGRNIVMNPQELAANSGNDSITIQKRIEVDALGCEDLLSGLLYSKFLVLVPINADQGFYEVIHRHGQRGQEIATRTTWRSPEEILRRPNLKMVAITTVSLQHINGQLAANSLRPFFMSHGNQPGNLVIGGTGDEQSIALKGFHDELAAAIRMVREMDRPLAERDPRLGEVVNNVQELSQKLSILEQGNAVRRIVDLERQVSALQKQLQGQKGND